MKEILCGDEEEHGQKKIGTRGYHSVESPANLNIHSCLRALGKADASIALPSLHANFKLFEFDYLMNSSSRYFGSGQRASSTMSSSLSIS